MPVPVATTETTESEIELPKFAVVVPSTAEDCPGSTVLEFAASAPTVIVAVAVT